MDNLNIEKQSITIEEFEEKYAPVMQQAAELIMNHPDLPEDTDQANILGTISALTNELRTSLKGRVPEIIKLQEDISKKSRQITKLQETNQALFLKTGTYKDPNQKQEEQAKPKKTWAEIKKIIDDMPG